MNFVASFFRRLWMLLRRDRATRDLEAEMRLHRDLRAQALHDAGLPEREAARVAASRFGSTLRHTEVSRDAWGFGRVDDIAQDVRYAVRRLRNHAGFTMSVFAVLALGIGATTAVFSAVDAAMLRPLPFERPRELVVLRGVILPFDFGSARARPTGPQYQNINDARAMSGTFSQVAAYAAGGLNLSDPENPRRARVGVVTANFFETLGVRPIRGTGFSANAGVAGTPDVTVLSWTLWQRAYGGADVIGTTIRVHEKPYVIVGVMPRDFTFPAESDLWIPLTVPTTFASFDAFRGYLPSTVIARVAPGVGVETANARLRALWERSIAGETSQPGRVSSLESVVKDVQARGAAAPLQVSLVGDRRTALLVLFGATFALLLIACANVTNLLLSYGMSRRREIAMRAILGATWKRILRQLLTESALLSLGGAAGGVLLAPLLLGLLRAELPAAMAGVAAARIDWRVLVFATALSLVTAVAFGLWPALGATRSSPSEAMKSGGTGGNTSSAGRGQRIVVAAELALTIMLLIGAGLLLKSFDRLMGTDAGLDPENVATAEMTFGPGAGGIGERGIKLDAITRALRTDAGISAVGFVNDLPLRGGPGGISLLVTVEGAAPTAGSTFARYLLASAGYFPAMGIPLVRGRNFSPTDDERAPRVVILSAATARKFWAGADPIGRVIHTPRDSTPIRVIGVVGDVRDLKLDGEPKPQMYFPVTQVMAAEVAIVVRGTLAPRALLGRLTAAVRVADRSQAIYDVRMMDDVVGASVAPRRVNAILISIFGALGFVLSMLGIFAVTAYAVAQRSREFGVRSALGATGPDLMRHAGAAMMWIGVAGIGSGLALAWALSRVLKSLLYGVTTHDVATFVTVPLVLMIALIIATWIPARRAMRVNPADVMRAD